MPSPCLPLLNDSGLIEAESRPIGFSELATTLPLLNDSGLIEAMTLLDPLDFAGVRLPLLNDSGLIEAAMATSRQPQRR